MTLIILMYALWACAMPISKYLLGYSTPLFLAGSRFLIGGLFLLGYQLFYTREDFNFKKKHWVYFAQIILLGICTTYVLRYWGLRDLPAFKTCFLYNLSPFMASFYSYLMFKERITKRQWTGLIIGFIGLIPMLISSSPLSSSSEYWDVVEATSEYRRQANELRRAAMPICEAVGNW